MGRPGHNSMDNKHALKVPSQYRFGGLTRYFAPNQDVTNGDSYQRHRNPADLIALSEVSFHTFGRGHGVR